MYAFVYIIFLNKYLYCLKNLSYFVQLSTRKDDFCLLKPNLDKYFAPTRESKSGVESESE